VHHFVNRAIGELALLDADSDEAAWEEALRLRDLLKFEFFFADKRRFADELRAEQALVADPRLHVAHRALGSFVDAQLVFAERLAARDPSRPVDRDELVRECLGFGRQLVLQGRLYAPESVARDLYEAAWRLAENRGLLEPGRAAERAAFRDEVASVAERIRRIGEIDARGEG